MCSQNLRRHSFYRLSLSKQICKLGPENRYWAEQPENCLCKKLGTEKIFSNFAFYIFFRVCFTFLGTAHVLYPTIISLVSQLLKPWQIRIFVVLHSLLCRTCRCFQTLSDAGLGRTSHKLRESTLPQEVVRQKCLPRISFWQWKLPGEKLEKYSTNKDLSALGLFSLTQYYR